MHSNRSTYTLTEYQQKLRRSYRNLGLVIEKTDKGTFSIFRPTPKTPWLPESRKKYFRPLYNKAKELRYSKRYSFCTLTYSTRKYTPESACKLIKHHIDLFFKRLGYRHSRPEYFLIVEVTDKMMPHVHLVFDRFVHYKKIFMSWYKVTGCTATDIRDGNKKKAIHYCFKYITNAKKQAHGKWSLLFKNIDRIWHSSRNFFNDPEQYESPYKMLFMLWNKNGILNEYFPDPTALENQGDLQECDVGLLEYDADLRDCIINVGRSVTARKVSHSPLAQPSQPYFDFFEKSMWID